MGRARTPLLAAASSVSLFGPATAHERVHIDSLERVAPAGLSEVLACRRMTGGCALAGGQHRLGVLKPVANRMCPAPAAMSRRAPPPIQGPRGELSAQGRVASQMRGGRRIDEQDRRDVRSRIDQPTSRAEGVIGRDRLATLNGLGKTQTKLSAAQHRQTLAEDLTVVGVSKAHLRLAAGL